VNIVPSSFHQLEGNWIISLCVAQPNRSLAAGVSAVILLQFSLLQYLCPFQVSQSKCLAVMQKH
jgi:hypothetical protein